MLKLNLTSTTCPPPREMVVVGIRSCLETVYQCLDLKGGLSNVWKAVSCSYSKYALSTLTLLYKRRVSANAACLEDVKL